MHVFPSIEAYRVPNKKWYVTICGEYQTVDFRHCHVVAPFTFDAQSLHRNHIENVTLFNVHFVPIHHAFPCGFRLDMCVTLSVSIFAFFFLSSNPTFFLLFFRFSCDFFSSFIDIDFTIFHWVIKCVIRSNGMATIAFDYVLQVIVPLLQT